MQIEINKSVYTLQRLLREKGEARVSGLVEALELFRKIHNDQDFRDFETALVNKIKELQSEG